MTVITMKSGKTIEIDEKFVKKYMQSALEEYVEQNHSTCTCSLNESNPYCDCDGNLTDKNFEIKNIEVNKDNIFSFTSVAKKIKSDFPNMVGVCTDGLSLQSDNENFCAYRLKDGEHYEVFIQKT